MTEYDNLKKEAYRLVEERLIKSGLYDPHYYLVRCTCGGNGSFYRMVGEFEYRCQKCGLVIAGESEPMARYNWNRKANGFYD